MKEVKEPFSYLFRFSVKYTVGTKTDRMVESMGLGEKATISLLESRYICLPCRTTNRYLNYVLVQSSMLLPIR